MKRKLLSFLAISQLFLFGCSNLEPVEEPTDASEQIEKNIRTIEFHEEKIAEEKQKYNAEKIEGIKENHALMIEDLERRISSLENENSVLESTLIYNDNFRIVQGTGVYIDKHEGSFNEQIFVSSFNTKMLKELERYRDEITDGAILIAAIPFGDSPEKMPAISIYYSQESLEAIDFEKASDDENGDYIYKNADYVKAFDSLSEELISSGDFDKVSELFIHYSGMTY